MSDTSDRESLPKARPRFLPSTTFAIMCLLTLATAAVAMLFDAHQDQEYRLVKVSNLIGLAFLTLLSGFLFTGTADDSGARRYLTLFHMDLYAAALFSTLAHSLRQVPGSSQAVTMLFTLCYFFTMLLFPMLWLYQRQLIRESTMTRVVTVLLYAVVAAYCVLLAANLATPILFSFTDRGETVIGDADYISMASSIICLALLGVATATSDLSASRKLSFFCCIVTPILFSVLSVNEHLLGWGIYIAGIVSLTVLLPLYVVFLNAHDELEMEAVRHERELARLQVSAMVSQMRPHFLYNSLAVIEALCEEDPSLAAEATNAFANYLRENMDFVDRSEPISFSEELRHIETYVWLERLRFPNKLNVVYDVTRTSFPVPALSVQPMVENAIKHGICKTRDGGTVTISSLETPRGFRVTVADDGVGFDARAIARDGQRHLGIDNTRYRLRAMVGGTLEIESAPGAGTTVAIEVPRQAGA